MGRKGTGLQGQTQDGKHIFSKKNSLPLCRLLLLKQPKVKKYSRGDGGEVKNEWSGSTSTPGNETGRKEKEKTFLDSRDLSPKVSVEKPRKGILRDTVSIQRNQYPKIQTHYCHFHRGFFFASRLKKQKPVFYCCLSFYRVHCVFTG